MNEKKVPVSGIGHRPVTLWLFMCCGMIFIMALLGAVTRLNGAGLSITDWNPIMGALPPLNAAAWDKAFAAYQQIPQYRIFHRGMSLEEFQYIFFWEWFHRLWGRLIGFVFAMPLLVFWVRGKINRALALKLLLVFALGGLQGFIGWFMVQSGLEVRTSVSPYRLALHLGFALCLYAGLLWIALGQITLPSKVSCKNHKSFIRHGRAALALLALTMVWGAFVAGLHAGEAYNTWPLMEGDVLPEAAFTLIPGRLNFFENLALVQFVHRWLGPVTMLVILGWVWRGWKQPLPILDRRWLLSLGFVALAQVCLGIATLLSHVNIVLATLHQAGAITLLTLLLVNIWLNKGRTN